jgi:SOS-response transcriptional repressor LexA
VVIDPKVQPKPGEIVAVKLPDEALITLRKYRPLTHPNPVASFTPFELIPSNEDWPSIIIDNQNKGYIIGTLIEHRVRRRVKRSQEDS